MKKSEQIKQLEAQIKELESAIKQSNISKLTKFSAYNMALDYLKTQPESYMDLDSFLSKVDEIINWYESVVSRPVPLPDNDFKVWEELFAKLAWKFTPTESGDMMIDSEQAFNEFRDQYLISKR